jgi:hypothetical protein
VRDAAATIEDVDLLVVGGPTHQLGITRLSTCRRAQAQNEEAPPPAGTGLREWTATVQLPRVCRPRWSTPASSIPGCCVYSTTGARDRSGTATPRRPAA